MEQKPEVINPFQRHTIARVLGYIPLAQLWLSYPETRYKGLENIEKTKGKNVTIVSSHKSMKDISVLDVACRKVLGPHGYPIFIKRESIDYTFDLGVFKPKIPGRWSQKAYGLFDGGGITVDQSDPQGMQKALPRILQAFDHGKIVCLFPGATREFGYVNGLFPRAVSMYSNLLKRNEIDHYFLPCGIVYDNNARAVTCSFGELYHAEDARTTGDDLTKLVCDFCGMDPANLTPKGEVLEYIKNRAKKSLVAARPAY